MNKFICIHGHFYQPPRENPWLDEVEVQDSAYPYHDWNERITSECYARNASARILDSDRKIIDIVNNYSKMSFNFGPTLLSWLAKKSPDVYEAILEADRLSRENFGGHGSALAQVYNHLIMPLANRRDKYTQIIWGIRDFEFRFKRKPEGMWLAETAVDLESLDIMAEMGIKFTILAPRQAKRVKNLHDDHWRFVNDQRVDTRMPYLCRLPSGRTISIFFYNAPTSQAVAFEGLLNDGESFARKLIDQLDHHSSAPQLVNIATDGETYGHHHKFGDMALAYCLNYIQKKNIANLTVYGQFLEKHPPVQEVEIFENSAWSCAHGVERWQSNCGCNIGSNAGWHQHWRAPLREGLNWLRDELIPVYEHQMMQLNQDGWSLRNAYIDVILDRDMQNVDEFFSKHFLKELPLEEKIKVLKLLEMQTSAQLMFTSCGWFFDDISGIETVQILKYAARAIQLCKEIGGVDLEEAFLRFLEKAPSNVAEVRNGANIYRSAIGPSLVDLLRVGAHYAITSLYEEYPENAQLYCYSVKSDMYEFKQAGRLRLAVGHGSVRSDITLEKTHINFVVLHFGDHNFIAGVDHLSQGEFLAVKERILDAFLQSNIPEIIGIINRDFGPHHYSLWHLFKEEQQKILNQVLQSTMEEIESSFRQIYEHHYPLMQIKDEIKLPLPRTLMTVVEFILNRDLHNVLEGPDINTERLQALAYEMKRWAFKRDQANFGFVASKKISEFMQRFANQPGNIALMEKIRDVLGILGQLNVELDLWKAQNIFFAVGKKFYVEKKSNARIDELSRRWVEVFEDLGDELEVRIY